MTFLALIAIIFFGFAVYNLTCAFVDIPTKKTSQMMMLSRKQQGTKNEKLLDVYVTKIAGWIAPYLRLDRLKRNKVQRALDIAGLQLTPEVYTARAWVTAGAVGLCAIPMAFLIPLLVPILIGLAVALWFSTYYAALLYDDADLHYDYLSGGALYRGYEFARGVLWLIGIRPGTSGRFHTCSSYGRQIHREVSVCTQAILHSGRHTILFHLD